MKKINLYLVRRNYGWGDYENWNLVLVDENESIYESLVKENNIEVNQDLHLSASDMARSMFDVKEVNCGRLAQLLG